MYFELFAKASASFTPLNFTFCLSTNFFTCLKSSTRRSLHYEVKSGKNLVSVKGSLKNHCQFWKNVLNASDYILNVIALGYILPFVSEPTSVMVPLLLWYL
jgi:hypothetical protein